MGRVPNYAELPALVSGFEQERYEIKFVRPVAATNLFTNPSFEVDATGVNIIGGASASQVQPGRRGNRGLAVFPTTTTNSGIYMTANLVGGTVYFFSMDVWAFPGRSYRLVIASSPLGTTYEHTTKVIIGKGKWERPYTVFVPPATATYSFVVQKNPAAASASTDYFVVDGWQVEADRLTTYLDGSLVGFVRNQQAYKWNGAAHASTSTRSALTRSGGEEVLLSDYGFKVMSILGLGGDNFENLAVDNAFLGGATYERSIQRPSQFDLVGAFYGSLPDIMRNKSDLRALLRYDAGVVHQPLSMKIRVKNECGDYISEPMEVRCQWSGGLAGIRDNYNQERTALSFQITDPYTGRLDGDIGITIEHEGTLSTDNHVALIDGVWQTLGTGPNNDVMVIAVDELRGRVYYGGFFTSADSVTVNRVCYWDIAAQSFVAMDGGVGLTSVRALAVAPNGDVWVGGDFSTVGTGAAACDGLARWNYATNTWTAIDLAPGALVFAISIDDDGNVYVGGAFTNWDGDGAADNIVVYNGSTWEPLGTGANTGVFALAWSNGYLYAGGEFTSMGGVANTSKIARWNGTTWLAMPPASVNDDVWTLAAMPNGNILVGGEFTAIGPFSAFGFAEWNGTTLLDIGGGVAGTVYRIHSLNNGTAIVAGNFTVAGDLLTADRVAIWTGSTFVPLDIDLPGTPIVWAAANVGDDLYLGFDTTGTSVIGGLTTITNPGSADAQPVLVLTGPGRVDELVNRTTGDAIYFDLTLLAGEIAVLDLTQNRIRFSSNFRANLLNTIVRGSTYNFRLAPGVNALYLYIADDDTATDAQAAYRPVYASLDDILYRT